LKAIVHTRYGSLEGLELRKVPAPVPKDNEVLIKVAATSLNAADYLMLGGLIPRLMGFGIFHPNDRILGSDVSGTIEAVGKLVQLFKPGDRVYGDIAESGYGGLAEYVCVGESALAKIPETISFDVAAAVPLAAITAWRAIKEKAAVTAGQTVLINGASGGVGTYAVMLAKALGARVTAVCSTRNQDLARSIGADHVIDYTSENFTSKNECYDVILAANGYHPLSHYRRVLNPQGIYVVTGGPMKQIFAGALMGSLLSRKGGQTFISVSSKSDGQILALISELLEAGKIKPVIDRIYPLEETVDAFRYVLNDHPQGKVVVRIES